MKRAILTAVSAAALLAAAASASADDAVSGVNGSVTAGAGAFGPASVWFGSGSLSAPIGDSFGVQIDATGGELHHVGVRAAAAHLFWRDPDEALLGVYADVVHFNIFGGLNAYKVGGEAEWYGLEDWDFSAVVGWEGGDTVDSGFDRADITYYVNDNVSLDFGHRYTLRSHAGIMNLTWQLPSTDVRLWGEGRWGEHSTSGAFAGITWAIGGSETSLRDRARHDDPADGLMDTINAGVGALHNVNPCDQVRAQVQTECCDCEPG
jgi:hypothetical protein